MSPERRAQAWLDGALDRRAEADLFADAEQDSRLAAALERAREHRRALAALEPAGPPAPPSDLVDRAVLAGVQRRAREAPTRRARARFRGLLSLATAAAAGALVFGLFLRGNEAGSTPSAELSIVDEPAPEEAPSRVAVRLVLPTEGASSVAVAGDFNGWRTDDALLEDPEGNGVFVGTLHLEPGSYAYMFVVDGEWVSDPHAANYRDDEFGHQNAVLRID